MPLILGFLAHAICYLVAGLAIQIGWNMGMVDLFGMPEATYANGVGLALLFLGWGSFPSIRVK